MNTEKYNGWTNYETWLANMWLDGFDEDAQRIYDESEKDDTFSHDEVATDLMSDYLEDWFTEVMPDLDGVFSDLLTAAVSEINFHEIGKAYLSEVEKEDKE